MSNLMKIYTPNFALLMRLGITVLVLTTCSQPAYANEENLINHNDRGQA